MPVLHQQPKIQPSRAAADTDNAHAGSPTCVLDFTLGFDSLDVK
jgi:hypothetical protein